MAVPGTTPISSNRRDIRSLPCTATTRAVFPSGRSVTVFLIGSRVSFVIMTSIILIENHFQFQLGKLVFYYKEHAQPNYSAGRLLGMIRSAVKPPKVNRIGTRSSV